MTSKLHHTLVMCYYIIQKFIETIRHLDYQAPPPKIWEVEPPYILILTPALLRLLIAPARLDFYRVTVSRGHGASPSERSNARLSVALRDRPGHAGSREEGSIWKSTWPKTLTGCNEQISNAFFPWLILCSF